MKFKDILKRREGSLSVQTMRTSMHPFGALEQYAPLKSHDESIYASMREAIPMLDAAIDKIVRLVGGFTLSCEDRQAQQVLFDLMQNITVCGAGTGIHAFVSSYLDSLLTYGNAVGEMILSADGKAVIALYNAPLENVKVKYGATPLEIAFEASTSGFGFTPVKYPYLILFSALKPDAGQIRGNSILKGLPFVSDILIKIYNSMGNNFDRIANLRYAVTYKPNGSSMDRAYSKDIALGIAKEWSDAMNSAKSGTIKDFIAVGDVDIKVIGADNQMLDTEIPVRQLLEQIIAKLGIPPFMLGLSWSTSERMSKQQSDILTSELEYYRNLLNPIIRKICQTQLLLKGFGCPFSIDWENINLQDEIELANARLLHLQADKLEAESVVNP